LPYLEVKASQRPGPLYYTTVQKYTSLLGCAFLLLSFGPSFAQMPPQPDPAEALADHLLGKLTLEEKVSLCHGDGTMSMNAIPDIGLTDEFWMSDGPNNVRIDLNGMDYGPAKPQKDPSVQSTAFPRLVELAATWDRGLALKFGQALGEEARARGKDMMLGPGVNIVRTPIGGRSFEYMGEDPYLTSQIAVQYILGVQSRDVAACVKHFALNSQELNRGGVDMEVDDRTLHEIYLPAFEAAVKEGHVDAVMGAYNRFRGEYCCQNDLLLNQILKKSWGFKGFVVSDWDAVHDTLGSAMGGLDVEMNEGSRIGYFKEPLLDAVKDGKVPMSVLDDKVRRILYVMAKIHKLDGQKRFPGSINTPEHQAFAREVAEQGIVLLKNEKNLLPLDPHQIKSLLIIGSNGVNKNTFGGGSSQGNPPYEITAIEGIQKLLGDGVKVDSINYQPLFTDVPAPDWKTDYFNSPDLSGVVTKTEMVKNGKFGWGIERKNGQPKTFSMRTTTTIEKLAGGTTTFLVAHDGGARILINGTTIAEDWALGDYRTTKGTFTQENSGPCTITVEYHHEGYGPAEAAVSWISPSYNKEGEPEALAAKAKSYDAVLFFTGDKMGRGEASESEGADRPTLEQPEGTTEALTAVLAACPNTIVINQSGAPVEMPWANLTSTLIQYWFSGMEGGNALARILFGEVNPSGKLPVTFPEKLKDSPAQALGNYNSKQVNYAEGILVGYRWFDAKQIQPLFPFGYGLSYTTFSLANLKLSSSQIKAGATLSVSADVTNTGKRAGAEVVQLYVGDASASVPRPPHELKGFEKVLLQSNETKTVTFTLNPRDLSYWDIKTNDWKIDPGAFSIFVGTSSRQLPLEAEFHVSP
jgi:beta-glucosidase